MFKNLLQLTQTSKRSNYQESLLLFFGPRLLGHPTTILQVSVSLSLLITSPNPTHTQLLPGKPIPGDCHPPQN
jgi:hypothetical protein